MTGVWYCSCVCLPLQYFGGIFWACFTTGGEYSSCVCLLLHPIMTMHHLSVIWDVQECRKRYKDRFFYYLEFPICSCYWQKILNFGRLWCSGLSLCIVSLLSFFHLWWSLPWFMLWWWTTVNQVKVCNKLARSVKTNACFWFWKPYKPK